MFVKNQPRIFRNKYTWREWMHSSMKSFVYFCSLFEAFKFLNHSEIILHSRSRRNKMNQMSIRSFLFNIAVLILILTRCNSIVFFNIQNIWTVKFCVSLAIQTQSLKNKLLLSGQILQQDSSVKDIEPGSRVVVRLRSTSQNNDTSQTMISQQMWTVDKFPIPFEINYSLNSVRENQLYEVNVRILNRKNVISFVNGQITLVKLFGANRTINVNVPLISFPGFIKKYRENRIVDKYFNICFHF